MASYNGYYVGGAGQSTQGGVYRLINSGGSYIELGAYEYPVSVTYTGSNWYVPASAGAAIGVDLTDYETGTKDHELIPGGFYERGPNTIGGGSKSISGGTDLCGKTLALRLSAGNSASLEGVLQLDITTNIRKFTVTWKDYDGSTLRTDQVDGGSVPTYAGTTPARASTAQYNYTFAGWSPSPTAVTGNTIYTATYTPTLRNYTVTWKDWDGTTLATETKAYGTTPSRSGPSRASTAQYSYTFAGWSPTPSAVTGNAVYTAVYNQTLRSYPITWLQDDGTLIDTTTVAYGSIPTHADPVKDPDVDFTYVFAGWSPSVVAATGATTYTATYTAIPNHRTVGYYDGSEWVECIPYYYDGSEWVEVEPYYYDGNSWVLCSQA